MSLTKLGLSALLAVTLSACAYKINVPQGNFLDKKSIAKLRVEMTREQVLYVLGTPVVKDSFDNSNWYYVYTVKYGNGEEARRELKLIFKDDKLVDMQGDYDKPEEFDQPLSS